MRRTNNGQDAEDVTATVFAIAWKKFNQLEKVAEPLAWLYSAAYHTLGNHYRTKKRRTALTQKAKAFPTPPLPTTSEAIESRDDLQRALTCLASLPTRAQEIVRLAAFEELSPPEIAKVLGIKETTARSALSRARKMLRESYQQTEGV